MTTVAENVQTRELQHVLQTYRRQPVTFVRGEGVRLFDANGRDDLAIDEAAVHLAARLIRHAVVEHPAGAEFELDDADGGALRAPP